MPTRAVDRKHIFIYGWPYTLLYSVIMLTHYIDLLNKLTLGDKHLLAFICITQGCKSGSMTNSKIIRRLFSENLNPLKNHVKRVLRRKFKK